MADDKFENWLKEVQQYGVRYLGCDDKPLTPAPWRSSFDEGLNPEEAVCAAYRRSVEAKYPGLAVAWPEKPCIDGRHS